MNPYMRLVAEVEKTSREDQLHLAAEFNQIEFRHYTEPRLLSTNLESGLQVLAEAL